MNNNNWYEVDIGYTGHITIKNRINRDNNDKFSYRVYYYSPIEKIYKMYHIADNYKTYDHEYFIDEVQNNIINALFSDRLSIAYVLADNIDACYEKALKAFSPDSLLPKTISELCKEYDKKGDEEDLLKNNIKAIEDKDDTGWLIDVIKDLYHRIDKLEKN